MNVSVSLGCQTWGIGPPASTSGGLIATIRNTCTNELVISFKCWSCVSTLCFEVLCAPFPVCLFDVESSSELYCFTMTASFTCTPMVRCLERGTGSITILLQQPAIRMVTKRRSGLYYLHHPPLLKDMESLGSRMKLNIWVYSPVIYQFTASVHYVTSILRTIDTETSNDRVRLMSIQSILLDIPKNVAFVSAATIAK